MDSRLQRTAGLKLSTLKKRCQKRGRKLTRFFDIVGGKSQTWLLRLLAGNLWVNSRKILSEQREGRSETVRIDGLVIGLLLIYTLSER